MAHQQLESPTTESNSTRSQSADTPAPTDDDLVTLTGPGGTDYRMALPEQASADELVAIATSISTVLSTESTVYDAPRGREEDLWSTVARHATVGSTRRPRTSTDDGWRLAARARVGR